MKRLYTIGMALAVGAFSTQSFAQVQQLDAELTHPLTSIKKDKVKTTFSTAKGDDETIIYWQEDFSNGFDGMGSNGAWDTEEDQGDLWFYTFPVGSSEPEAYDPAAALVGASDAYGTNIPNYFGTRDVVNSPTRDNGVVMVDGDRWNSTSTEEAPDGTLTQNPFLAALISPSIDLSGVDNALLTFYHYSRVCCSGYALSTDISVDGGDTWIPYDVFTPYGDGNDDVDIQVSLNISEVLQGATDLTDVRLRFFWNGSQSHYFWSIDDIQIQSLPDNDMVAGETWYNNYFDLIDDFELAENALPAVDYYREFEYLNTPDYFTRPFDFAMEVTNAGALTQTNVQLNVTVTSPSGVVYTASSEPGVSIETTVTDTLMIENVTYADILDGAPIEEGEYLIEYNVSQDETDSRPDDNMGATRATNVSMENGDVPAYFRNDGNNYEGAYVDNGQDVIWGTPYVFTSTEEQKFITHIETVFLFSADFAETLAGEVIYFNVREGSVLEEDDTDPETITTVFFDSENPLTYEDSELEYTIEEEDIWSSADGFPFVWASFELPEPIMIEENKIYQAEYRIPAAGGGIVFPPVTGPQEKYASVLYDFADGAWFFLGTNAMPIRFRTASGPDGVEDFATVQDGITLMQNFPNPFNTSTRIQYMLDEASTANFEVRDITGKVVYNENLGTVAPGVVNFIELNKGSLSAGVYTYSIVTPDYVVTRKLTVE